MKRLLANMGLMAGLVVALAIWVQLPLTGVLALVLLLAGWLTATRAGRQAALVTRVGLGTVGRRLGSSLVIVLGIAGVVGVLTALLAMGAGLQATLAGGGSDDAALILRGGAPAEAQSVLGQDEIQAVTQAPGVAHDNDGRPLVSGEVIVAVNVTRRDGDDASVQLRGVDDPAWAVRPGVELIEGRPFRTGMQELVVGRRASDRYAGLKPGDSVQLGPERWDVVGVFESGDGHDSELWADRNTVASAFRRGNSVSALLVGLTGADAFDGFKAALESNPQLNVRVQTTAEYFAAQSEGLVTVIRVVGIAVAAIMAIGAIFGALNCMFAAVAARAREIATLRAMGFRGLPVVVSIMLETMILALAGGLLGALLAWVLFNGHSASTLAGMSQVVFSFKVDFGLMWTGIKWALAIGLVGGLFPAVRAARLPVTVALRET